MFKDYYKILGIVSDANSEEIKKAYRSQSMRWHPDRNQGMDTTKKMQDINEAYNILKDPVTRARYDAEYVKFNSARYEQPKKEEEVTDYDITDETLQEDIKVARKAAEDYVREFYASLKTDSKKAAKGAWEKMKGYLIGGVIMTFVALVVRTCIGNQTPPTMQDVISTTYSDSNREAALSDETIALRSMPSMIKKDSKHWNDHTFFNSFKISVPVTVERQTKDSPYGRNLASRGLLQIQDNVIVFNQKGLCDMKPEAQDQYCRIMIQFIEGEKDDFLQKDQTEPLDREYDQLLSEMVENEIGPGSRLMGTFSREWVRINNANAILVSYRRTGYNYDTSMSVNCKMLLFQHDSKLVKMILSYREKEAELWADDFEQVMRSFEWMH